MLDRVTVTSNERTFEFGEVLRTLCAVFHTRDDAEKLSLRGRVKHLQQLGLMPPSRGAGRKIEYSKSDIYDLALALEIATYGIPPRRVVREVERGEFVKTYSPMIAKADAGDTRVYMILIPSLFHDQRPEDEAPFLIEVYGHGFFDKRKKENELDGVLKWRVPFGISDITELKRRVDQALLS